LDTTGAGTRRTGFGVTAAESGDAKATLVTGAGPGKVITTPFITIW
jgi:hypothetical protein